MLTIASLFKRHGEREVLRGVSLTVAAGQVAVLIGPSGSGKSTLLRCVNGLEPFDGGTIQVGDQVHSAGVDSRAREVVLRSVRRRVGMVFQQFNLFPHLTVLGNVIEAPVHVLGLSRDEAVGEATGLLHRVGLGDRLDSFPRQLSGGQQQRVAIARALAMRPELVLFDEPTSSLDPKMTAEVLSVMGELAADGQTMLVVTHAMDFARQAANEVHVISDGVIVESGPPVQVLDYPRHPQSKELLRLAEREWARRVASRAV
jgi:polar amino acid transport system ATP-binding protein